MEKLDLNKKSYEVELPQPEVKKKKPVLYNVILMIVLVVLVCLFVFLFKKYTNRDALDLLEDRVNMTINLAREVVNDESYTEDYLLINFPDTKEVITKDGLMTFNNNELEEFLNGYIIVYKNSSIAFKLSDGEYCATKSYDDASYKLFIFGECFNYDVEYK